MTIHGYLRKLDQLKWSIESKKEKILVLESIASKVSTVATGAPPDPNRSASRMADAICQKVDLEASIKEDESAIETLKSEMSAAIDRVESPKHRAVLYKRFIRGITVETIADEILYSERTTQRLVSEASKMLEEALQKTAK